MLVDTGALGAIVLALAAALGSAVHGGFDLANTLHPPVARAPDLPNPVDPRGTASCSIPPGTWAWHSGSSAIGVPEFPTCVLENGPKRGSDIRS
jgi:hypothetical protein